MFLFIVISVCLSISMTAFSQERDIEDRKNHALQMAKTYFAEYNKDSVAFWISRAEHYASLSSDTAFLSQTNSIRGYVAMNYDSDFVKAGQYFLRSYDYAVSVGDKERAGVALADLVMTYYNRHDTTGMQYARRLYATYAGDRDSKGFIMGAVSCSFMYEVSGDYATALQYAKEALDAYGQGTVPTTIYALYASLLNYVGNDTEALRYFRKGLAAPDAENIWLEYAEFLMKQKKWREAAYYLQIDLERMENNSITLHTRYHHKYLSDVYKAMGDYVSALEHYQEYARLQSNIFSVEKESAVNDLLLKYETEQKNRLIQEHELDIARKNANIQILTFCLCIVILCGIAAWIMYRHTGRMYKAAIARHQDYLKEISRLTDQIHNEKSPDDGQDVRSRGLFAEIERAMREESLYKIKGFTLETLAERVRSNRGYVSKAINLYAGQSFNSYVNNFRVNAAARMLSGTDIPIKAIADELGFSSSSMFYRAFQQTIGVPPAKYRKETRYPEREGTDCIFETEELQS